MSDTISMNEPADATTTASELVQWALVAYEKPLLAYAFSLLKDIEKARDVVQDSFLKLYQQDPDQVRDGIKPWLFTVCRNRSFDILKKDRRMIPIETEALEAVGSESLSPDEETERRETHQQVIRLLANLPENQREVIRLRFQSELSYREISEITDLSVSNVGFLLHTGLKRLRTLLNDSPGMHHEA